MTYYTPDDDTDDDEEMTLEEEWDLIKDLVEDDEEDE
jgi:hypothetical protein